MFINLHTHIANSASISCINTMPQDEHQHTVFSCGLHPWYLQNAVADFKALKLIAMQRACIGIGECGLDKVCATSWDLQINYFTKQVLLANTIKKPIIIHCVKSSTEIISIIQQQQNQVPIIVHGFNQNERILNQWDNIGAYYSIGKALLQHNSNAQQLLPTISIEKLFLETDNDALNIETIYAKAAEILQITINNLQQQISTNFNTIFAPQ